MFYKNNGKAKKLPGYILIQISSVNQNIHLPTNQNVFMIMLIRARGNVKAPLNPLFLTLEPLFLTLDPPSYSNEFKNNPKSFLKHIKFRNVTISKADDGKDAQREILEIGLINY